MEQEAGGGWRTDVRRGRAGGAMPAGRPDIVRFSTGASIMVNPRQSKLLALGTAIAIGVLRLYV